MKTLLTVTVLAVVGVALYFAPQAIAAHNSSQSHTSYVERSNVVRMLAHTGHTQATKGGAFIPSKSIESGNVESAHQLEVN